MAVRGLLGKDEALKMAGRVIDASPGDMTEVLIRGGVSRLTRFSDNYIHQNVSDSGHSLTVKVIFGKKIGTASTNSLDEDAVKDAIEAATRVAELQKPNEDFEGIPGPEPIPEVNTFFDSTYEFSPLDRAMGVKAITERAAAKGFKAAGAYSTGASELCIANSLGVRAYNRSTQAHLRTVVMSDTGSGYADALATDVKDIDPGLVARTAVEKCEASQNPQVVPAGEYEVILEPRAVADLLSYLVRGGFSASAVREGRSFLAGRLGEKIFTDLFSFWDDGLDPRGFPMPFDLEGVPKEKVIMVDKGVAKGLLYDWKSAKKEGKRSTGHGGFGGWGPMAANLFMAPGDSTVEEMIKNTKRGILVTRFHYTNMAHPMKVLVTGMTRDGTFLVEDGKVTKPVKNFRFTESALKVFGTMDMVGKELHRSGRSVVPAIHVPAFTFTGVTEF
ncbi:MAG TPA: TldD/PmbA family protein [Firmicutes bacterium]|nr:TldD/PmbA family protein [Candidatus Fermentithermobacillaceae bacterium]